MISFIVPVYNQQEYLSDCLESILSQRVLFDSPEIIVVIDGSQDNSAKIAKKYPVKVIEQVNKGLASARNTGIMNAIGDYIWLLDADDLLKENVLEIMEKKILENSDADVIAPSFKTFGTSNQEIILMPNPKLEDFRTGNRIGYCAAIRKSALMEVGGYNPKMVEGYEDLSLTCQLLARGKKIVTIPEVLWLYRTKEKSMYTKITPEIHKKLLAQINVDVPSAQLNF